MNGNAELLNFVYQNSQMGSDTIDQILDITEDNKFKEVMEKQRNEYRDFHEKAKDMLNQNGFDEKGIATFEKVKAYLMINMQTMTDKSTPHIAEMMVVGSNMGIINAIKNIRKYNNAEKDILNLMKKLQKFEEDNAEKLKEFL